MNTENEEKLYEFIVNYEERIYANEERREDALVQQASHMQTAFSVLSTVILMVAAIVIDHRGKLSLEYLLATFSVICSTLLSSLFCATKAQKRYSRKSFQRADGFHVDACFGYNEDIPMWEYNPDEAAKLVAASAYNGEEIEISTKIGLQKSEELALLISESMNAIGFNTKVNMVESAVFSDIRSQGN